MPAEMQRLRGELPAGIDKATKRIDYGACISCMCCHELCMYRAMKLVKARPAHAPLLALG